MKTAILLILLTVAAAAQPYKDMPMRAESSNEQTRLLSLINPLIEKAKATFPGAKKRFTEGLQKGEKFLITTRLYGGVPAGRFEQVFVRVLKATRTGIDGYIISDPMGGVPFKKGDKIKVEDKDVIDWTIMRADGTEEGNLCGKAVDAYQEGSIVLLYVLLPGPDGKFADSVFADARDGQGQDMEGIVSEATKEAGRVALARLWAGTELKPDCVTGVVYQVRDGKVTVTEKKLIQVDVPNQSREATATAITPAAGQPSRQP